MARNDGIDRTVARNQDLPTPDDVAKIQEHNEREKDSYSNQDIVPERTPLNVHFKTPTDDYVKMFEQMEQDGVISTRATLGCILPSCIIVTLLAYIYTKYRNMSLLQGTLASLRPAVVAMIAKAGVTILVSAFFISGTIDLVRENVCIRMVVFFGAALVLLRKFKMNPILVMVLCGVANMIFCGVMGI